MSKREDFSKYLANKYPSLFDKQLWVECNEGWYDLIDELTENINNYCATLIPKYGDDYMVKVGQIKEKFGGLRYYVEYQLDDQDEIQGLEHIIRKYEIKSYELCEDCGGAGDKRTPRGYWIKTLCSNCTEKYKKN